MHNPKPNAPSNSFSSFTSYLQALSQTRARLAHRATSISTTSDEMIHVRARSGSHMKRSLRWYDLIALGIGGMVGAGVFVTSGKASHVEAGPSVIISYAVAGLCALLSAFCYTEFAVELPVAGGAFSYLRVTFGEFAAFITGANLIVDYVTSNAGVARAFSSYLGKAIGVSYCKWRFVIHFLPTGFNQLDPLALAVILLVTLIICYSTRESSMVNIVLTALHIAFVVFIIVVGFVKGNYKNFTHPADPKNNPSGFFPYGAVGVIRGAATVYMSYIGYDAVSTMAEEVREPSKDIPIGVSGSVIIVTVLYCLMAASMSMLLPYDLIDPEDPFAAAFGSTWVASVIGVCASFGIFTSLIVAMLGQSRYMCVIGRSNVVPAWFARVHPRTSTPLNSSAFLDVRNMDNHLLVNQYKKYFDLRSKFVLDGIPFGPSGIFTAALALFTELDVLLDLVSIGTLFVFYMVANALIYRRYVVIGTTNPWPTLSFLCSFSLTSITITLIWHFMPQGKPKPFVLGACVVMVISMIQVFYSVVPQARKPEFWGVPLMPWIPCVSIFLNIFLLGTLDRASYIRFAFFSVLAILVYIFYSVHASFDAEEEGSLSQKDAGEIIKESGESVHASFSNA